MAEQLEDHAQLWSDLRDGTTTHGVRVEVALSADVHMGDGPTALCVASHSDVLRSTSLLHVHVEGPSA